MTKPKAKALGPVGSGALSRWADESVPDLTNELSGTSIDAAAFSAWIAGPLGSYRASKEMQQERPQAAALVAWLTTVEQRIERGQDVRETLTRELPEGLLPHVWYAAYKVRVDWDRLLRDWQPVTLWQVLESARHSIDSKPSTRGRPSARARDALLNQVLQRLQEGGISKAETHRIAEVILIKCRVQVPEESIPRAARRGR